MCLIFENKELFKNSIQTGLLLLHVSFLCCQYETCLDISIVNADHGFCLSLISIQLHWIIFIFNFLVWLLGSNYIGLLLLTKVGIKTKIFAVRLLGHLHSQSLLICRQWSNGQCKGVPSVGYSYNTILKWSEFFLEVWCLSLFQVVGLDNIVLSVLWWCLERYFGWIGIRWLMW